MKKQARIRVLIVDDHDMLREGLTTFLKAFQDLELVGEASNGVEAVNLCRQVQPHIVLMDLVMPEMDGVSAIRIIHSEHPEVGIIALTSFGEEKVVKAALQAGAKSYLLKNISAHQLAEAIRVTYSGFPTLAPEVTQALITPNETLHHRAAALLELTAREKEVLDLLVEGCSNDSIAIKLNISRNTVKNHMSSIFSKLNVSNRTEAVLLAIKEDST
jgi:two-component system, NarL family, response regulator LiaR